MDNERQEATKPTNINDKEDPWGYDLYPERRGERPRPKWWQIAFFGDGRQTIDRTKCERNVYYCLQNSPMVKLMTSALKASGCNIDIRRHIACEICDHKVSGGYDPELNQIVVCENVAKSRNVVQGVLAHEMIHMFDYCRHQLDFKNINHLACTEIRAANLTHCSFMSAWAQGDASLFRIRRQHAECVKSKANPSEGEFVEILENKQPSPTFPPDSPQMLDINVLSDDECAMVNADYDAMTMFCARESTNSHVLRAASKVLDFQCPNVNSRFQQLRFGDHDRLAHPTDCRHFYMCLLNGLPRLGGCSLGLVFNPRTGRCDRPKNVPGCEKYYGDETNISSPYSSLLEQLSKGEDLDIKSLKELFSVGEII
nr:EOG090X0CKN [Cyclestheria hislopi]